MLLDSSPRNYQQVFYDAIEADLPFVYAAVQHQFQDGWKKITNAPQHGNFNPNYLDVLNLCEAVITSGNTSLPLPIFPFDKNLGGLDLSGEDGWWTVYNLCVVWSKVISWGFKRPQTCGVFRYLLDGGYLLDLDLDKVYLVTDKYYLQHYSHLHPDYSAEMAIV